MSVTETPAGEAADSVSRRGVVALHAGYWLAYVALLLAVLAVVGARLRAPSAGRLLGVATTIAAALTLPNVAAFYTSYVALSPLVPRRRPWWVPAGWGALVCVGAALAAFAMLYVGAGAPPLPIERLPSFAALVLCLSVLAALHAALAIGMRGFVDWYGDLRAREERERRQHALELDLVRSRLDPHFLFNSLNNIDVLIGKDPAIASAYLHRLSELMRYVLYETAAARVPLATELAHVARYMEVEALRHANPRYATFEVVGEPAAAAGAVVPPALFLPFVENAFKHAPRGAGADTIRVRCEVGAGEVTFRCANRVRPDDDDRGGRPGGLGDALVRRRLELLYPGRHALQARRDDGEFSVRLTIPTHDDHPLPDR